MEGQPPTDGDAAASDDVSVEFISSAPSDSPPTFGDAAASDDVSVEVISSVPSNPQPSQLEELNNSRADALAKALSSMISNLVEGFDSKSQATLSSQDQLNSAIDRLTRELDQLLEDAPLPFMMQHAAKISSVRKRVSSLNSVLKSIQKRIDNIDRMLSVGVAQEKAAAESS